MLNKKLSLILLAAAAVVELTSLVWIRGEYRSTMIDGAEYQVPAAIDFKGDFYERNYLPVTVPLTEAPWHGEKAPEKGEEIYLALTRNADGMMEITGAQDTRPGGDYLITRVLPSCSHPTLRFDLHAYTMWIAHSRDYPGDLRRAVG